MKPLLPLLLNNSVVLVLLTTCHPLLYVNIEAPPPIAKPLLAKDGSTLPIGEGCQISIPLLAMMLSLFCQL
jgi:hypothetical protein